MTSTGLPNAAGAVLEWSGEPLRQGSAGAGCELQAFPREPCQGASHGFEGEDGMEGFGADEAGFEVGELRPGHAVGCKVVLEFSQHDFTGDGRRMGHALSADKGRVLVGARRNEGCKVAEVAGSEDGDMVVDAEVDGREREKAAPTREDNGFGFAMMGAGSEPCRDTERVGFEMAATDAQRRAARECPDEGKPCRANGVQTRRIRRRVRWERTIAICGTLAETSNRHKVARRSRRIRARGR